MNRFLAASPRWRLVRAVVGLVVSGLIAPGLAVEATSAAACPFCSALKPTVSQQRESARVVVLGELASRQDETGVFRLHTFLKGESQAGGIESLRLEVSSAIKPGQLVLLLGNKPDDQEQLAWTQLPVNETSYVYYARAPSLRDETSARLRYFARFLEHADAQIAGDAFLEFGHAPYDQVAGAAGELDSKKLRSWLLDPAVSEQHKGFYGLALGLAASPAQGESNVAFLANLVRHPGDDFRAGFDGVLGGYLVAGGASALEEIEKRFLANPKAANGHVRHAMTALRFYQEFGKGIPQARLNKALRCLLDRPEFADKTIVDLARWEDWDCLSRVVGLYHRKSHADAAIRRAIVGYLLACPDRRAEIELRRLRRLDPELVEQAERAFSAFGGGR